MAAKEPMSRTDVVNEVAAATGMAQSHVEQVIRAFEDSLKRQLVGGGEVRMVGFGTFKVSKRDARTGRNPSTGETIKIAASKNVRFTAGTAMKDALNGKKAAAKAPAKAASKSASKAPAKKKK